MENLGRRVGDLPAINTRVTTVDGTLKTRSYYACSDFRALARALFVKEVSPSSVWAIVVRLCSEGYPPPTVLAPTTWQRRRRPMLALRRSPPASMDNAIVITNAGNNEEASVDHLADGEFDVKLHYMGIATEDIQAM